MSYAAQIIAGGSFTSDASVARQVVQINERPDLIWVRNRTAWGDDAAETSVESWWRYGMAQDSAQTVDQAVTSGILSSEAVTANGFRVYNTAQPPTYAANTISAISNANPAVATVDSSTGSINVGDVIRVTNSTGMLQIAGYDFSVTAVSLNTSVTLNFDAQNEAAAATDGEIRLIIPNHMYPRHRYIVPVGGLLGIDQASQCVVCTSVYHDFTVGEKVTFRVTSDFGMSEINNVVGTVVSIGNASGAAYSTAIAANYNALKVDIDTSGFSAFALPASATAAAGFQPAMILPAGSGPYPNANPPYVSTNAAFDNRNQWQIVMGSNIITSTSAVYDWAAYKYADFSAL